MATDCEAVSELIPWLVNRTAGSAEQALAHGHIARCDGCRSEYVAALALAHRMRRMAAAMPAASPELWARISSELAAEGGPSSGGLARLLEQLLSAAGMAGVGELLRDTLDLPRRGIIDPYVYIPVAWQSPSQA